MVKVRITTFLFRCSADELLGRQQLGSYINLIAYYILGIPISLLFGFVFGLELVGLWSGVAVALFFISVVECVILYYTDWEEVRYSHSARPEPLADLYRLSWTRRSE